MPEVFFAIDFESYYDKQVSITTQGIYHYLRDPDCDIYLVAVYSKGADFSFVGEPRDMDWSILHEKCLVAHNARFDRACFERLQELGLIPAHVKPLWQCTADMASALGVSRSLQASVEELLGMKVDKGVRNDLLGKSWQDILQEGKGQEVAKYCLKDAWYCYQLWEQYSPLWGETERRLSAHTRDMCDYGVMVDCKAVAEGLQKLERVLLDAANLIPWADGFKPVLSPKLLKEECAKAGIPAPQSLAQDSEDCSAWEDKYGEQFPWVAAMRDYRKANTLHKKLTTLNQRLKIDSIYAYGLKYFGAHTGRWSGDSGFNMQNLPRQAMFDVNLREMVIPRPGHGFIISDLGQIEQRVLSWLAGDNAMMEELAKGVSVYEAHARSTMGYDGDEELKHANPDLYRLAKARVLGLGYGAGAGTFVRIAKTMAGLEVSPSAANRLVNEFRASNRLILELWAKLERAFSMNTGKHFSLPLPSGRSMHYRHLARTPKGLSAVVQGKRYGFFGGKLAENLTSATARDVLGEALLRLEDAGFRVVMHVHDEVVVEAPLESLDAAAQEVHKIMTTAPNWLQGLPLTAETITSTFYTK